MTVKLIIYLVFTFLALVLYTVGVWYGKKEKRPKAENVLFLLFGFAGECIGTAALSLIKDAESCFSYIQCIAYPAFLVMLIHVVWASYSIFHRTEETFKRYNRFSVIIWALWIMLFILCISCFFCF